MGRLSIQEMHFLAGNQDLSEWQLHEEYSIESASLLCAGIDPNSCPNIHVAQKRKLPTAEYAHSIRMSLFESIRQGHITPLVAMVDRGDGESHDINIRNISTHTELSPDTSISLDTLQQWAQRKNYSLDLDQTRSPFFTASMPTSDTYTYNPDQYRTPALDLLHRHIQRHWKNFDPTEPDTAPDKVDCMEWLNAENEKLKTSEQALSKRMLEAIDLLARHPVAKGGNRKKRRPPHSRTQ